MRSILLINPGHDGGHSSHHTVHRDPPPLGILYVGTFLRAHGYDVTILDTHIHPDWRYRLERDLVLNRPLYVGISVIIGRHQRNAQEITNIVHAHGIPVVWGGVMATVYGDELKETYSPDFVVRYQGEIPALEIAAWMDGRSLPTPPAGCLDDMPIPDWSLLPVCQQQTPYYHNIMSSRGCPFNCTFCYKQSLEHKAYEMRSASHVVTEMEALYDLTQSPVFTMGDDNFLVNRDRAQAILDHCRERGWYIEECIGHINNISDELIDAMSGVVQTFIFSVESASPRLQTILNKRIDLGSVPDKVRKLEAAGIVSTASFMVGLPTETWDDVTENREYMNILRMAAPLIRGNTYLWFPLPKTKLTAYTEAECEVDLDFSLTDYEEANFWVKDHEVGRRFRPWLSEERFNELTAWGLAFNETFKRPRRVYVLDRILNGETVDLQRDLY